MLTTRSGRHVDHDWIQPIPTKLISVEWLLIILNVVQALAPFPGPTRRKRLHYI
jgi:hypothetical protein